MSACFIKVFFCEDGNEYKTDEVEYRNKPFSNSRVFEAAIKNYRKLTEGHNQNDVNTVYQLDLSLENVEYDFLPGDSIGILPENNGDEVKQLLTRLNLNAVCDKKFQLELLKDTPKKNAIPKHIPPSGSLRRVFLKHIDIRTAPKKLFLKALTGYTDDPAEKEKLEAICSPSRSQEYVQFLTNHRTLLSTLNAFPHCHPPVELILAYSSPLNPRWYSIASSPLDKKILSIIFFVVEHENGLKGVCTGWLEKMLLEKECGGSKKVMFYFRKPGDFRLVDVEKPNILIATGTGISPFRSFLQHKAKLNTTPSNTWLFYGCRYSKKDFLCQNELEDHLKNRVLFKLHTAFSRDSPEKVYVQDRILACKEDVADLILNEGASVFICGDAKTVVGSVREAFVEIFMEREGGDRVGAENVVDDLVRCKRYLVDSWI